MENCERIDAANRACVAAIVEAQPYWVDILPAREVIEGLPERTVLHSGPPIAFADMCELHRRGMIGAALLEGWAGNAAEAANMLESGAIRVDSALNYNTVGSGVGIVTPSVALMVVEDRRTGKRAGVFPHEGAFGGGFCGWGVYSKEIAENLRWMREELFPVVSDALRRAGGISLKPILAESLQMGDENHSRQTAADLLTIRELMPCLARVRKSTAEIFPAVEYFTGTPRFFHNIGQAAARAALLSAHGIADSTVVTAMCGNGVEFGIKVSGLGDRWFTAPSPMIRGYFARENCSEKDQLPWIGDSSVCETVGLGGIAGAASPIVCAYRQLKLADAVAVTREMQTICAGRNPAYVIPNLDFDCLPVGVDVRRVVETGIAPVLHGGIIDHAGGWIGAGGARVPMECFSKALDALRQDGVIGE